jgi:alanine-synthesizing transaminase
MAASWASQGLSVAEVSQELGVTPKSVNERVRNGYREEWKSVERIASELGSLRFFIRDHGYSSGDQIELADICSGETLLSAINARWQVTAADSNSFAIDFAAELDELPLKGGRARRLLTIRTTSYRRPDLGRAVRLCHPADVAAIKKLTAPQGLSRGNPMSQTVDAPVDSQPPSGGIFEDKPFYRIAKLPTYVFAMINEMRAKARAAGLDVIDLGMGNPDGATPKAVVAKLVEASKDRRNHRYSVSKGIWRLREAMCQRYERSYGVSLNYEKEAIVTMGVKDSLAHLISAVIGPGDRVVMPDPAYPIHQWGVVMAEGEKVALPMPSPEEFLNRLEDVYRKGPAPKMVLVSFPHNPTTQIVEKDFFETIVAWAHKHGTMIVHDFAYADLGFDGYKPPSLLEVDGAKEVGVELFSMSKSYNMAGWRIGFCLGNQKMIYALARIKSYLDYGAFQPIQIASIIALRECEDEVVKIRDNYQERRDVLVDGLNRAGWPVESPKGTMFLWAKIPERYAWAGSLEFAKLVLEKGLVAVSPGIGFGPGGEGYVRFSLIENEQRIRQACRGIKKALAD